MSWRGWTSQTHRHKKKLTLRKRHFFVIEKHVEDVKQDEKDTPDLLEAIMKPPGLGKEELRRILCKMRHFRRKIIKIRVSAFECSENRRIPAGGQCQPSR